MNTVIHAPAWANPSAHPLGTPPSALAQLVNITGPLASGMAAALEAVQAAEVAEDAGRLPVLTSQQRSHVVGLCLVVCQVMAEAAQDACEALPPPTH